MTNAVAAIGVLAFLLVAAQTITHRDLLLLFIRSLIHLHAISTCSYNAVRRAYHFYRGNYGFAVEDVRRSLGIRL